MAISAQVSSVPSNIVPPSPRTFQWGQQGTIEMKPIEDVVRSTLAPGEPMPQAQPELDILSTDPMELIQRQYDTDLKQIDDSLAQAKNEVTLKSRYKLGELEEERKLKETQLRRKFNQPLKENETMQERQREFKNALADLNDQIDLAKLRISNKTQPDVDAIDRQGQIAIQQIQQGHRDKLLQLQTIDALVEDGTIQDPIVANQKRLKIAGVDVPITGLREKPLNWDIEQSRVSALIRQLEKFLSYENIIGTLNPETGEMERPSEEEIENATSLLQAYKVYYNEIVMPNLFPQHREIYKRASKLGKAAEYARGKTPTVPATGEPVRTIGTEVARAKEKVMPNRAGMKIADPLGIR